MQAFNTQRPDDDSEDDPEPMPTPKDLPSNVRPTHTRKHVGVLSSVEPATKTSDMKCARVFKEEHLKTHKYIDELENMLPARKSRRAFLTIQQLQIT